MAPFLSLFSKKNIILNFKSFQNRQNQLKESAIDLEKFTLETLKGGDALLAKRFAALSEMTPTINSFNKNREKNRFCNIFLLEETRVVLPQVQPCKLSNSETALRKRIKQTEKWDDFEAENGMMGRPLII